MHINERHLHIYTRQMLMNVPMEQQIVIPMPSVLTLMVVMSVLATLVLEETDINATVNTVSL